MPITDPHICHSDRESEIWPRGNPESKKLQCALALVPDSDQILQVRELIENVERRRPHEFDLAATRW
ncbi:MAG: hypothetical protein WBP18_03195, partial [Paracoccaceae bacterium]